MNVIMTTKIVIGFVIKARINQIKPLSPNRNNKVKEGPSNNSWSLLVIFYFGFSNSIFPAHGHLFLAGTGRRT